jgi:hypothetical protein
MTTLADTEYVVAADTPPITVDAVADVGNARTVLLVRKDGDDVPIAVSMPSIRTLHGAFSYELFAARGLLTGSWGKLGRDEHIIERDGAERFVGGLAAQHTGAASSGRGSDQRYLDGTTLDFVLAGVASALPSASKITVRLTTMLPISLWPLAARVAEALRGRYTYRYNGRELSVTIASVTVKREAEAAFGALDGDTSGPIVIVDAGGRTVNVALFNNGEFRSGRTLELGVQAALDNLDRALIGRNLRALTLAERGELESALIGGRAYAIIVGGVAHPIDAEARKQLDLTASALAQELYACVPLGQARRIVFVGGGAHAALFGAAVRAAIPQVEPGGMKELANAYGALGAAPKKGKARK